MPSLKIEHRLGVAAPPYIVWEAISDLSQWAEWNPTYPHAEGRLSIGAPIAMDQRLPGSEALTRQEGTLIDWVPDAQLLWKLKPSGGIKAVRYVEIDKLSDDGVILANGALLDGWRTRFMSKHDRHALRAGFEAMNQAAKVRAEDLWRRTQETPISRP